MNDLLPLLQRYQGNRVVRGLIQLVPFGVGSALDVVLTQTLEKIRIERAQTYFDELDAGDAKIDLSLLASEDFVHCYMLTTKFALNTRRRDKIKMFARLLKNSVDEITATGVDEYEEFAGVLDDLHYREIQALNILDEYSDTPRDSEQNDLQWMNLFWNEFENRMSNQLNIPQDEIDAFMNRIVRTGCYETLTGMYWDYKGGQGKLTPTYRRLKKFIVKEGFDT